MNIWKGGEEGIEETHKGLEEGGRLPQPSWFSAYENNNLADPSDLALDTSFSAEKPLISAVRNTELSRMRETGGVRGEGMEETEEGRDGSGGRRAVDLYGGVFGAAAEPTAGQCFVGRLPSQRGDPFCVSCKHFLALTS